MKIKNLSKAMILCPVVLLYLSGCTDDEQAKMMERQKQIESQKSQEPAQTQPDTSSQPQASEPAPASDESQPTEEASPEPKTKASPEPKTKIVYHFTSNSETRAVKCAYKEEIEACGASFQYCGNDGTDYYHCQTGVHMWRTEEPDND